MTRSLLAASAALFLLSACPPPPETDPPVDKPPALTGLIDLGGSCLNSGAVIVHQGFAYASCAGTWAGDGAVAIVDLSDDSVKVVATGGAPGPMTVLGSHLVIGDMGDGQLMVMTLDGVVVAGGGAALPICPSDFGNNIYQFISGLTTANGKVLASCFATDELLEVSVTYPDAGSAVATVDRRVTVGDGASSVALWGADTAVVLDNLAGTVSTVDLATFTASVGRFTTGAVPNDLEISGDTAFIVNSGAQTLQVLDMSTGNTLAEVPTGDNTNPYGLARVDENHVAVSLLLSGEAIIANTGTSEIAHTFTLPTGAELPAVTDKDPASSLPRPQGVAVTADGRVLVAQTGLAVDYSANAHGTLAVIDLNP